MPRHNVIEVLTYIDAVGKDKPSNKAKWVNLVYELAGIYRSIQVAETQEILKYYYLSSFQTLLLQ